MLIFQWIRHISQLWFLQRSENKLWILFSFPFYTENYRLICDTTKPTVLVTRLWPRNWQPSQPKGAFLPSTLLNKVRYVKYSVIHIFWKKSVISTSFYFFNKAFPKTGWRHFPLWDPHICGKRFKKYQKHISSNLMTDRNISGTLSTAQNLNLFYLNLKTLVGSGQYGGSTCHPGATGWKPAFQQGFRVRLLKIWGHVGISNSLQHGKSQEGSMTDTLGP